MKIYQKPISEYSFAQSVELNDHLILHQKYKGHQSIVNPYKVILIGQSAVGKDTVADLVNATFPKLVSHTTRPPRPHEVDGKDYYFRTSFDEGVDPWIEKRSYKTIKDGEDAIWHYWLDPREVKQDSFIGVVDYEGAKELRKWMVANLAERPLFLYIWATVDELKLRAAGRPGYEEAEFMRRLETDMVWEESAIEFCDGVIENKQWEVGQ